MSSNNSQLIEKYKGNFPRYTSYPTALEFRGLQRSHDPRIILKECFNNIDTPKISLYIHLPYCPRLCYFCACNKIVSTRPNLNVEYLDLLSREVAQLLKTIPVRHEVVQIHLGGGSPSYLTTFELLRLSEIFSDFNVSKECNKSIEIDPRTIDPEKINLLYELGYRRFSIGIQDFDERVQEVINRQQSFKLVKELVDDIRNYRNTSINFDLIYGLPGQSPETINQTIEKTIDLSPDRIALYGYAHVNWRVKVQNVFNKHYIPAENERAEFYTYASETLKKAGYKHIGLDHFAKETDELYTALKTNKLKRNFMGYTTVEGDYVLGCGVSSISDLGEYLLQNFTEISDYRSSLQNNALPISKVIHRTLEDKIKAAIIGDIMCSRQVSLANLMDRFNSNPKCIEIFEAGLSRLSCMLSDGLIAYDSDKIIVTTAGNYYLRQIASRFDSYFENHQPSQRFSAH